MKYIKSSFILFVLILIIPLSLASDEWIYYSEYVEMESTVYSAININPNSANYIVEDIEVTLSIFPKSDYRQTIDEVSTTPSAKEFGESFLFEWQNPTRQKIEYSLDFKTTTSNIDKKIKNKVNFPINTPAELKKYTLPTEIIDSEDKKIIELASSLAEGETDLFVVLFKLTSWVSENIEYDLSCGATVEKASWVLENRKGTCDEFSSLLIALCRSLGIPARYISGTAYSNLEVMKGFGPHAWAEVYFPGNGWIPYDPTYQEIAWVDPSHLKMKEEIDPNDPSVSYEWRANNVDISADQLNIQTRLLNSVGRIGPKVSLDLSVEKGKIGYGSYNLLKVSIKNLKDYYVATQLVLAETKEIEVKEGLRRFIMLEPNQEKEEYWIIKIQSDLDANKIYTVPVAVFTVMNDSASSSFTSSSDFAVFSLQEIESIIQGQAEESEKEYSKKIILDCKSQNPYFYTYEEPSAECKIKNSGNVQLSSIDVCIDNSCENIDLGISEEKTITLSLEKKEAGPYELMATAKNDEITKTDKVNINFFDEPSIKLKNLKYPKNVNFDESFELGFTMNKTSYSNPSGLIITVRQNNFWRQWTIDELHATQDFVVELKGNMLHTGSNELKVELVYFDKKGNKYTTIETIDISLDNVTASQRIMIILYSIQGWFEGLFS